MTISKTQYRKHLVNHEAQTMAFLFSDVNDIDLSIPDHRRMLVVTGVSYRLAVPFINMLSDSWKSYFTGYMDCLCEFPYTNKLMFELLTDIYTRYELSKISEVN